MILDAKPLTLAEVKEYIKDVDENKPIHAYLKSFSKISVADMHKLKEGVIALNNPKVREHHLVKLADILPKDTEEINKIFIDASLSEEEANAILEVVRKY